MRWKLFAAISITAAFGFVVAQSATTPTTTKKEPEKSAVKAPAKPTAKTPAKPTAKAPAKSTANAPAKPTAKAPAKPAVASTAAKPASNEPVPLAIPDPKSVVAKVNGEPIYAEELIQLQWDWFMAPALDELILYKLIEQEAQKEKIVANPADVDKLYNEQLTNYAMNVPPGRTTNQQLRSMGLPLTRIKARAKVQTLLQGLVLKNMNLKELIHVRHLLVRVTGATPEEQTANEAAAKEKIDKILAEIKEGKKFEDAVKEYTDDAFTKANGGDMSFRSKKEMDPTFGEVAFSLKTTGDIGGPVRTSQGFHLIQLIEYGDQASQEQQKQLKDRMLQMNMGEYIRNLQEKANIYNKYVPFLKPSQMMPQGPRMAPQH